MNETFENRDTHFWSIIKINLITFGLFLLAAITLAALYWRMISDGIPSRRVEPPRIFSLEQFPGGDRQQEFSSQRARLDSYGWVDQSRGIVHIPIEEAMKIISERLSVDQCSKALHGCEAPMKRRFKR